MSRSYALPGFDPGSDLLISCMDLASILFATSERVRSCSSSSSSEVVSNSSSCLVSAMIDRRAERSACASNVSSSSWGVSARLGLDGDELTADDGREYALATDSVSKRSSARLSAPYVVSPW